MSSSVATIANVEALDELYHRWQRDPQSVDASWRGFFEGFELGSARPGVAGGPGPAADVQVGVVRLIMAYRELGHFLADLDPLSEPRTSYSLLDLSEFGLSESDLDVVVDTRPFLGL